MISVDGKTGSAKTNTESKMIYRMTNNLAYADTGFMETFISCTLTKDKHTATSANIACVPASVSDKTHLYRPGLL